MSRKWKSVLATTWPAKTQKTEWISRLDHQNSILHFCRIVTCLVSSVNSLADSWDPQTRVVVLRLYQAKKYRMGKPIQPDAELWSKAHRGFAGREIVVRGVIFINTKYICVCGKWITSLNNNIRFTAESKHYQVTTYNCVNHHHPQHGVFMYGVRTYIQFYLSYRTCLNIPDCWSRSLVDPWPTTLINPIPLFLSLNQTWVTLIDTTAHNVFDVIFHRRAFQTQYFRGSDSPCIYGMEYLFPRMGWMWVAVERLDVAMTMYPSSDPRAAFPGYSAWPYTNRGHMPYIES